MLGVVCEMDKYNNVPGGAPGALSYLPKMGGWLLNETGQGRQEGTIL